METTETRRSAFDLALTCEEVAPPPAASVNGASGEGWYRCSVARYGDPTSIEVTVRSGAEPPDVRDVLDMLAAEAGIVEESGSFEAWANQLGFDVDSRSAERAYQASCRLAQELRGLLGERAYERLVHSSARL
jgi:hypothetical protein